ncbi:hypothetical protein EVAR_53826_1 [Eumeta japonica]|uniref:Uncharacterized protein n=1 Tax=Eumeta variegata TaxID=151549 RepID=A0A4C1ZIV4_EUMVA|nr:hypothetical protein EVAR_53826_1 [Eumeta japonica]
MAIHQQLPFTVDKYTYVYIYLHVYLTGHMRENIIQPGRAAASRGSIGDVVVARVDERRLRRAPFVEITATVRWLLQKKVLAVKIKRIDELQTKRFSITADLIEKCPVQCNETLPL